MSHSPKRVAKLSTLDAAKGIYFIVTGLAIKEALTRLSTNGGPEPILIVAYLATALRYTHGISILYGHDKAQVEETSIPSSLRIFFFSLFLILLGIVMFLMASSIAEFPTFLLWTLVLVLLDFFYVFTSGTVRKPLLRPLRARRETRKGYPASAALQWMKSDVLLVLLIWAFYARMFDDLLFILKEVELSFVFVGVPSWSYESSFAIVLLALALVDYADNFQLYFGGKGLWLPPRVLFICSPLSGSGSEAAIRENIRRAQFYCREVVEHSWLRRSVAPFAAHAFFPYFLRDDDAQERWLGRHCALLFLKACDQLNVYVPQRKSKSRFLRKEGLNYEELSVGMAQEVEDAYRLGLFLKYLPIKENLPVDRNFNWQSPTVPESGEEKPDSAKTKIEVPTKRVSSARRFGA